MASSSDMISETPADFEQPNAGRSPLIVGDPVHELYPAMDARFVLVEIGKLTTKIDRLIDDVAKLGEKVDVVRSQISFVKGAAWIIGGLIVVGVPIATALITGKLSIAVK